MGIIQKLFSKKSAPATVTAPTIQPTTDSLRKDPNYIRVFDKYGREYFLTKEQWRTDVLPGTIRSSWNTPDQLYGTIVSALKDGFRTDVVDAAHHLFGIDTNIERGTCLWGVILMEEGRLDEAEKIFRDFNAQHGERGYILTNLAKIYAKRNDHVQSEATLWHALEIDPNQENAVGWYEVIHRERNGEEAGLAALRRIAEVPGSWRAELWLARAALKAKNLDQAIRLYGECLTRMSGSIPSDVLMQISGDLGNGGYLSELLKIVDPLFDVSTHGLMVGNNLIKAHLELKHVNDARRILNQLYALKRPDWIETLSYWDTEIAKASLGPPIHNEVGQLEITMLVDEGPVWLDLESPEAEMFPTNPGGIPLIAFLGSSAEKSNATEQIQHQLADPPGRMSRALPMFLAEQVSFGMVTSTKTLVPWVTAPNPGFVLAGYPWTDADAAKHCCQADGQCNFVVLSHIKAKSEPWTAELRLIRISDGQCIGQLDESFSIETPVEGILSLARQLQTLIDNVTNIKRKPMPLAYSLPPLKHFPSYLLRLEQLLTVRCAGMEQAAGTMSGEREILSGNIQLCLDAIASINTRILLARTLKAMKRARPDILPEFKERIAMLQKELPLSEPGQSNVQRLIDEAFNA